MSLKVNSFVRLSIYLNCSPYFITRLVLFFPPCTGTFFLPVWYANHIVGICLNCPSLLWNTLPASQYSRNCGSRGLPLSPFSPLCPRGPGGPGWPGGPAGPRAPRRTDSMLSEAQWWGREEQARAHPSILGRELLVSMRRLCHRIPGAVSRHHLPLGPGMPTSPFCPGGPGMAP